MEKSARCPKCQGDVFLDWAFDEGGWFEYCLQCGRRNYLPLLAQNKQAPVKKTKSKSGKSRKRIRSGRQKSKNQAVAIQG